MAILQLETTDRMHDGKIEKGAKNLKKGWTSGAHTAINFITHRPHLSIRLATENDFTKNQLRRLRNTGAKTFTIIKTHPHTPDWWPRIDDTKNSTTHGLPMADIGEPMLGWIIEDNRIILDPPLRKGMTLANEEIEWRRRVD